MKEHLLRCIDCGSPLVGVAHWLEVGQACPGCGSKRLEWRFESPAESLKEAFLDKARRPGMWRYLDLLPLSSPDGIVSAGEGDVPVERWVCLEAFAESQGVRCEVFAHRHDLSPKTGTFKDLSASLAASVLGELGIGTYVIATTGNIGVAFARYFASAGITLHAFVPRDSPASYDREIEGCGQRVHRVDGDYTEAKRSAEAFARSHGEPCSPTGFDPIRHEAKKTMAFEWARLLDTFPSVYVQALSGGIGPIGVHKGCRELHEAGMIERHPRLLLVQSDRCAPMAAAWSHARANAFRGDWTSSYPVIENPPTSITTLATGNPGLFPRLGEIVRSTGGEIVSFPEARWLDVAGCIARETEVRIGPAAAIGVGGFLKGVQDGHVRDGDVVVIAVGEGVGLCPAYAREIDRASGSARWALDG